MNKWLASLAYNHIQAVTSVWVHLQQIAMLSACPNMTLAVILDVLYFMLDIQVIFH